jgi:polyphenol oxidase
VRASFRLGPDGVYRCDAFQEWVWQKHGFGTRWGNPTADITLRQKHSNCVVDVRGLSDREAEGDALVTDQIGISIGIRTADCVPILLLDCRNRVVAAIHAGWRGTVAEIVCCAIDKLVCDFKTDPKDLYAAIGPCIRECCYEVGQEVAQQLLPYFPEWAKVTSSRNVDLSDANCRQMTKAGVRPDRIFDSGLCTGCDPENFFSYRREPQNSARAISAISRLA